MLNPNLTNVNYLMFNGNVIHHTAISPMINKTGYTENIFNNGSVTMTFHFLTVHEGLGGHAKDGRCAYSRN